MTETQLLSALKQSFGFDAFKGQQLPVIEHTLAGGDSFVLMPTGGGKSLCYQLPALLMEGTAVIFSPLIALMKNQVDAIRGYCTEDGIAHFLNSTLSRPQLEQVKEDLITGRTKLLYVAPEALHRQEYVELLRQVQISFYAVDEAHCISEWGHDFRPEYRRIRSLIEDIASRPIMALTATATPKVQQDIMRNLKLRNAATFQSSFNRPNLFYRILPKTEDTDSDIVRYILTNRGKSGIIYCMRRTEVERLAEILQANGIKALPYHAGMEAKDRMSNQDDFLEERAEVIVATIAFGMGIDKPDVRYVIHYDMPKSLEGYYQETGRAGRDGGEGVCIAYYDPTALGKLERFTKGKSVADQEIAKVLLRETADYAETKLCRRAFLLHYFGERYEQTNCGSCDNCLVPKSKVEAKELLLKVLEVVSTLKEKFNEDYVVTILRGETNSDVESFHHEELECFGIGESVEESTWTTCIRQALIAGYLTKDVEHYGLLKLTPAGKKFMKKPTSFVIEVEDESEEAKPSSSAQSGGEATDPILYGLMKDLRKKMGQQNDVPPYVIFQDASLEAMATLYPITLEELQNIPGVGAGKAARYGQKFLELIRRHVQDNDIQRPADIRVRTTPNKSKLKVSIIQQIDRKVALDDIAIALGLDFEDLIREVEAIVYSGTRININYFIEDVVDEDRVADIYEYFKESVTDDINEALSELGSDYSEEEVRLIRIKFLSELAN